jgi:diacylglycerol kinase (ATP)
LEAGRATTPATPAASDSAARFALVIANPAAGQSDLVRLRDLVDSTFRPAGWRYRLVETGQRLDLPGEIARARGEGCRLVVAVGGDGTVSLVGDQLVGTDVALGIIPLGTGNVLARELGIPLDPLAATALCVGPHRVVSIDAMRIDGRHYFLNAGIGLNSLVARDTERGAKRLFGMAAYVLTLLGKATGHGAVNLRIRVDGREHRVRAWDIIVANAGAVGSGVLRWGRHVDPSDGRLDLLVWGVPRPLDYVKVLLGWPTGLSLGDASIRRFRVTSGASIVPGRPLPVQADGEMISTGSLSIDVVPKAVSIVVPIATVPAEPGLSPEERGRVARLLRALSRYLGPIGRFDTALFLAISGQPHPAALNALMRGITWIMSKGIGWALGVGVLALTDPKFGRRLAREALLPMWLVGIAVEIPVKRLFGRQRPFQAIVLAPVIGPKPGGYSFPSAHTAVSFAAAWLLGRECPRWRGAFYGLAALVGLSRVYLGAHYASDVLVGALVGLVMAPAARGLARRRIIRS